MRINLSGTTLWRREFIELHRLIQGEGWILLYGRRKTGKTFLTKRILKPSLHLTVSRNLRVIKQEQGKTTITDLKAVEKALTDPPEGLLAIDEFQRLPLEYWELISTAPSNAKILLLASSHGIVGKVFDERSPLLGLVYPYRLDIIHYADAIVSLYPLLGAKPAVLWATILRDPWLAGMPGVLEAARRGEPPWRYLSRHAHQLYMAARGIVGEAFSEEGRSLTRLYDTVLHLTASGTWNTKSLAQKLYERRTIDAPNPGIASGILDKMSEMGLIKRTRLWKTRGARVYYRHSSPLLGILYGLEERLGLTETLPTVETVSRVITELYSRELQFSIGELLAEHHGGRQAYTILPHGKGDLDVVVLHRSKDKAIGVYEIKMGRCGPRELSALKDRALSYGIPHYKLVCLDGARADIDHLGPADLVEMSSRIVKNRLRTILQ